MTTLTNRARRIWGTEQQPAAPGGRTPADVDYFVEALTFADAGAILEMLDVLTPQLVDGILPVWVRNLAYRLACLQRPDDPALLRRAARNLWAHGPDWDGQADALERRADLLDAQRVRQ